MHLNQEIFGFYNVHLTPRFKDYRTIEEIAMHIEAELDEIHAQRLLQLQQRYDQPLSEVLARLIDADWKQAIGDSEANEPSPLFQAFENAGLIGCIGTGEQLSETYKEKSDYAEKHGGGVA